MNLRDIGIKEGMTIKLPSLLRDTNINDLSEEEIKNYLNIWLFHSTPNYKMSINEKERLILIFKLRDIIIFNLPKYMYTEFKNILDLYSRGYWLATISTSGAICEYLTKFFIPERKKITKLEADGQKDRIKKLSKFLDKREYDLLIEINEIRNNCLHLDIIDIKGLEKNAIKIINYLIELMEIISVKYFDFLS